MKHFIRSIRSRLSAAPKAPENPAAPAPAERSGEKIPAHHHRGHRKPRGESRRRPPADLAASMPSDSPFRALGLRDEILAAIVDLGFETPTPIQSESIPHSLAGRDIAGRAQTGTGKTAAFLIAIIQKYLAKENGRTSRKPMALVLAPTRELALQIGKDADLFAKHSGMRKLVVYGGMDYQKQRRNLDEGVDLLVATPGRLLDYLRSRPELLSEIEILVIDEADRMLDMGFIPDVKRIIGRTPPPSRRQTMFYSATLTPAVLRLSQSWTSDPVRVEIEAEQVVAEEVEQMLYSVAAQDKLALFLWLLQNECGERVLVFCNRRVHCDSLARKLERYGVNCAVMSGDVPQKKRLRVLEDFRAAKLRVIVATDVAGRGIHVDDISHVINYDLPYEAEDYVHRIGRTGRAGVSGKAISFACEEGAFVLPEIEAYIGHHLTSTQPDPDMLRLPHPPPRTASPDKSRDARGKRRRSPRERRQ